jgi:small nuclear ribonucleoprotein (snRNP)-like protein
LLKRIGYWVLSLGNNLGKKTVVAIDTEVSIITRFENSVKGFLEKVESEYNFILARSMEYLNWRYCDPRGGDYVVFQASTVDEIVGYMVVRVVKQDTGMRGVIVDSLVHPGRTDVLRLLLGSACDYFDKYDINEVATWLVDSHPDNRVFKECGFMDTRNGPYVFMGHQDIGTNREKLANSSARQIHFKIGDTDWI